jgi:hypothetical protein
MVTYRIAESPQEWRLNFDTEEVAKWNARDIATYHHIEDVSIKPFDVMGVHEFHEKLDQIDEANGDTLSPSFRYEFLQQFWNLRIIENGRDDHELVHVQGATPEEACRNAWKRLPEALESWDYVFPFSSDEEAG